MEIQIFKPNLKSVKVDEKAGKERDKLINKIESLEKSIDKSTKIIEESNQNISFLRSELPKHKKTAEILDDDLSRSLVSKTEAKISELDKNNIKLGKKIESESNELIEVKIKYEEKRSYIMAEFYLRAHLMTWELRYDLFIKGPNEELRDQLKEINRFLGANKTWSNPTFIDSRIIHNVK